MNDPMRPKYGFYAAVRATNREMEDMPVRSFFPWAPVNPREFSRASPDAIMLDVIARQEIDDFIDKVVTYWRVLKCRVPAACDLIFQTLGPAIRIPKYASQCEDRHVPLYFLFEIVMEELFLLHGETEMKRIHRGSSYRRLDRFVAKLNGKLFNCQCSQIWRMSTLSDVFPIGMIEDLIRDARIDLAARLGMKLKDNEQ
jgi:hypothetical protein